MVSSNDFRKGVKVLIDGAPYTIIEAQFVKPGKGNAFTRTRFKHLIDGRVIEQNVRSGVSYPKADTEESQMEYLYKEGDNFVFMNTATYDQTTMTADNLGDAADFLVQNATCNVMFWNGTPISVELPNFVELEITYCEPGIRGDTAQGTTKPATLSTGAIVQVPLFVDQGETIRVDTRTGTYMDRVKKQR